MAQDIQNMREALTQAAQDGALDDLLYPYIQRFQHPDQDEALVHAALPDTLAEASGVLAAPIIDNIDGLPVVECVPIFYTHMALLRAAIAVDGAGNTFMVSGFQDGNWTRAFIQKVAPDGATVLGQWQLPAAHSWKQDAFSAFWSGRDLVVYGVAHDTPNPIPPDGRLSVAFKGRIPNVWTQHGNVQMEAGGESRDPQAPQEVDVTPEEVVNAFVFALNTPDHPLAQAVAKIVKNNADIGAAQALGKSYADENGSFYRGSGPYKRFRDTVWEQVHKVLTERGLGTPPPPQPKEED